MTLLNAGLAAAGLACIAVPIVIHLLFRRRRKPVLWGAMRFLMEAYRKQRKRLRLEQFLLLAARCLLVLLVALALGRPVLERAGVLGTGASRTVYLLIDNGLASGARAADGKTALERHKASAGEVLDALGPADRAALIALGGPTEPVVLPPSSSLADVRSLVDALRSTDSPTDVAGAVERLRTELGAATDGPRADTAIVVLSDFFTGSADTTNALPTLLAPGDEGGAPRVRVLAASPAAQGPTNLQIVSVEPLRSVVITDGAQAEGAEQVTVRLRRTGEGVAQAATTPVRVRAVGADAAAGERTAQGSARWSPGQTEASVVLSVETPRATAAAGAFAALVAEIDRDGVDGDNVRARPLAVREELRVGVVGRRRFGGAPTVDRLEAGDWIRLALRPSQASPMEVVDIEPAALDAPSLAALDAAVIVRPDLVETDGWQRLRRFVDGGGLVVVFPPTEASVHLWSDSFTEAMSLPWRIAREPVEHEPALALAPEQPRTPLLGLIADELQDLAAPVRVLRSLPVEGRPSGAESVLLFAGGAPFILAQSPQPLEGADRAGEGGLVVYFAAAPVWSWTDLPAKPLMLPLVQEIVRQGVGRAQGAWASVAGSRVAAPGAGRVTELRPLDIGRAGPESEALLLDDTGRTAQPVRAAGLFRALDARGGLRGLLAVNPDADAGRTDTQAESVVQAWLGAIAGPGAVSWIQPGASGGAGAAFAQAKDAEAGSPVSLPLLIAALVVAAAEMLMARWFSHARVESAPGRAIGAGAAA